MKNLNLTKSRIGSFAQKALPILFALSILKPASEAIIKDVSDLSSGKKGGNMFVFQTVSKTYQPPVIDYHNPQPNNERFVSEEVRNLKIQKMMNQPQQAGMFDALGIAKDVVVEYKWQLLMLAGISYLLSGARSRVSKTVAGAFSEGNASLEPLSKGVDKFMRSCSLENKSGGFGTALSEELGSKGISEAKFIEQLRANFLIVEAKDIKSGATPTIAELAKIAEDKLKATTQYGPFFWKKFDNSARLMFRGKGITRMKHNFSPSIETDFITDQYSAALKKTCAQMGLGTNPDNFKLNASIKSGAADFDRNVVKNKYVKRYFAALGKDAWNFINPRGHVSIELYPKIVNEALRNAGFWERMKSVVDAHKIDRIMAGEQWQEVIGIDEKGKRTNGFWENMRQYEKGTSSSQGAPVKPKIGAGKIDKILAGEAPEAVLGRDELKFADAKFDEAKADLRRIKKQAFTIFDWAAQKYKKIGLSDAFKAMADKWGVTKELYLDSKGIKDAKIVKSILIEDGEGRYNLKGMPTETQKSIAEENAKFSDRYNRKYSFWGRGKYLVILAGIALFVQMCSTGIIENRMKKDEPVNNEFFYKGEEKAVEPGGRKPRGMSVGRSNKATGVDEKTKKRYSGNPGEANTGDSVIKKSK